MNMNESTTFVPLVPQTDIAQLRSLILSVLYPPAPGTSNREHINNLRLVVMIDPHTRMYRASVLQHFTGNTLVAGPATDNLRNAVGDLFITTAVMMQERPEPVIDPPVQIRMEEVQGTNGGQRILYY
ncbi:hypothetical protein LTR50_006743 [Elasticomyces elasticus]|nr:hypothetical protein LTR50_006743 [Elasticomyces elasticus]